jgi:hypothetical protein
MFYRRERNIGRVGLDLSRAMRRYESADNLILRDGDNITIPSYNAVVTIRGAVNLPSAVAYVPGRNLDYYIDAAGGPAPKADRDHAYVVQPSGRVETFKNNVFLPDRVPTPRPGSIVTVPFGDGTPARDWIPFLTGLLQIVGSTVAIIVAVTR